MFLSNNPWEAIVERFHRSNTQEDDVIDEEDEEEEEEEEEAGSSNGDEADEEEEKEVANGEGSKKNGVIITARSISVDGGVELKQQQKRKSRRGNKSNNNSSKQPNIAVKRLPLDEERLAALINRVGEMKFLQVVPGTFDAEMKELVPNLRIMATNPSIVSLQTIIRNRQVNREDFVFNADRLIRLVIEEGLNLLPFNTKSVITPTGGAYEGVEYLKSNCGVSIVRSGEAMEKALRDCCRSIRIGKVLIQSDEETHIARVVYAKLPADISLRKVLLLYPIMSTGNTVVKAIKVLKKNGVKECNIILVNLFTTPVAIRNVASRFPELTIQTTEVHPIAPHHFGQKYFGTD